MCVVYMCVNQHPMPSTCFAGGTDGVLYPASCKASTALHVFESRKMSFFCRRLGLRAVPCFLQSKHWPACVWVEKNAFFLQEAQITCCTLLHAKQALACMCLSQKECPLFAGGTDRVLYPASCKASTDLQDSLAASGFQVHRMDTYDTVSVCVCVCVCVHVCVSHFVWQVLWLFFHCIRGRLNGS